VIAALSSVLLAAIRAEPRMDREQFHRFYEQTARPLRAYLARVGRDAALAEDLLQDAYLRFLRAEQEGRIVPDRRRYYLFQIAANLIRDHYRRQKSGALEELSSPSDAPAIELRRDLSRILDRLTPAERNLLWLAYVERFSHNEIASIAGVKPQSVRPLLFRAKQKLAGLLRKAGIGAA
jgi:RNA polymerase sigma-70 factor (ECF subfamily)